MIIQPLCAKPAIEDEGYYSTSHSARSDSSDCGSGPKLSAKVMARMNKLENWRIRPSSIKFAKDAHKFHGGYATVSKALLVGDNGEGYIWNKHYNLDQDLQPGCQSSGSDDHNREAADRQRGVEGDLGEEEDDNEQGQKSDSDILSRGKTVAVKKLRIGEDTDLERALGLALRETEFLVDLSHPNIVKIGGFVEDLSEGIIWLVFSWQENGNLKDFVASRDWEIPERISLINDVAKGLEYLHTHESPICHGDLKSLNVLVNSEYRAVITDFGSARRLTDHDPNRQSESAQNQRQLFQATFCASSNTITLTGNKYTLRWAAPELLYEDEMSLWSDIWAFGWIAYEVMTNSIPFQDAPTEAVVIQRVIEGNLPSVTDKARLSLVHELCSLMVMCWNNDPTGRPTAEYLRKNINWMPIILPNPSRERDPIVSSPRDPDLLRELGSMYQWQSDYPNAHHCFTEALRISTDFGDEQGRADAMSGLAQVHRVQSEYTETITLYAEALQIYTDIGDREGRADPLWGLAEVHRVRGDYSEAITHYSEALQIRTDIGDKTGQAFCLWGLADVHRLRKEYSEAITLYSEVLHIHTEIGDRIGRACALWGLAEVHRLRDEYSEAITLYTEVLQICTDIGDRKGRADVLWALAEVHRVQSKDDEATILYSEALQIRTAIGNKAGRASALWGLADIHRVREEYNEAIALYSEVAKIRTEIGDRQGRASALWGLAEVHRARNEYNEATTLYSEALQIRTDIGDRKGKADALWGLAQVHRLQNKSSQAVTTNSEDLQIGTDIGDRQGKPSALRASTEVHRAREEDTQAVTIASRSIRRKTV